MHPTAPQQSPLEMVEDALDVVIGLTMILLPLFIIAMPGVILLLIVPAALLLGAVAIPALLAGALLAPPYLLVRMLRRARR